MKIIDAHCDVLYQLWKNPSIDFNSSSELRIDYQKWQNSNVKIQCFAIFVPDDVPHEHQFSVALEMVNIFYERILGHASDIKFIRTREDIASLKPNEKGAMLTLEGCHPIGEDLNKLKTLIHLGVRAVGLTWNQANAVCDGIGEKRGAGLSSFGEQVVNLLNDYHIWTDVSHISYQGFWDVMKLAKFPMASHSNVYAIAKHRRNLDQEQIEALIERNAFIGVTFVPEFLTGSSTATANDLIQHMQAIIDLGGENSLGLGSDFDGTSGIVKGIENMAMYDSFVKYMEKFFSDNIVEKITCTNFIQKIPF